MICGSVAGSGFVSGLRWKVGVICGSVAGAGFVSGLRWKVGVICGSVAGAGFVSGPVEGGSDLWKCGWVRLCLDSGGRWE